jgi:small nuclear ribonucleoprotein (snRNP)-like protein
MLQPKSIFSPTRLLLLLALPLSVMSMYGCKKDNETTPNDPTKAIKHYKLEAKSSANISGGVTFWDKGSYTRIEIRLNGVNESKSYPASIHLKSAVEGGDIALNLNDLQGKGVSITDITKMKDGTPVTYAQLMQFDGHLNVFDGAAGTGTLISQGDIGANELTTDKKTYTLDSLGTKGLKGTATFTKRVGGHTLVALEVKGTAAGKTHLASFHANSAVEGGDVVKSLNSINGATGKSLTTVRTLNNGTAVSYDQLMDFDGYINIHLDETATSEVVAQKDFGGNEITATNKTYTLAPGSMAGVTGTARFDKRKNGTTLVTLALKGLKVNGSHPAHIRTMSVVEGGDIAIDLTEVSSATGKSVTHVRTLKDGTAITYDKLVDFDGYLDVQGVMSGDIGGNELTGTMKEYAFISSMPGVNGVARFAERKNGNTLVTLSLPSPADANYVAGIKINSAAETGDLAVSLNNFSGNTGRSATTIRKNTEDKAIKYADLMKLNGSVFVKDGANKVIALTDIGTNELIGTSKVYTLHSKDNSGVYGNARFDERKDGTTLVTITLTGTLPLGSHVAHIGTIAEAGEEVTINLSDVDNASGKSYTSVRMLNDKKAIKYSDLMKYNGHISIQDITKKVVAQGNIGVNAQ